MSFIFAPIENRGAVEVACANQGWTKPIITVGKACLAVAGDAVPVSVAQDSTDSFVYAFIGSICNLNEVRRTLSIFNSGAVTASEATLAVLAVENIGFQALALFDGAFVLLRSSLTDGSISVAIDVLGQHPLYATQSSNPWLAPNPRLVCLKPGFIPEFFPEEEVVKDVPRPGDFVPIKNVTRARPGWLLGFKRDGMGHMAASSVPFHSLNLRNDSAMELGAAIRGIEANLIAPIINVFEEADRPCVPLSGGVDSSIVAAVGASVRSINTVAMGTSRSNEYAPAKLVASHIGSDHQEMRLETDDILRGFFDAIYYNGIFDGYAAEVQSSLFALFRKLEGQTDSIITGYGADLLFGGIIDPQNPPKAGVNATLWEQVYRTQWSGEFSPVGANMHGFAIRHPFWTPRLVDYCLDLNPTLKVSDNEVKVCLREFAEQQDFLPKETVWRRKIAIHHGSSVDRILADELGTAVNAKAMSHFAYSLYRRAVSGAVEPTGFDPKYVLASFHQTA